MEVFSVAYE